MFVEKIEKTKKGTYKVTIDGSEYLFSEDTIVMYRLAKGHETTLSEVNQAKRTEELQGFYSKALSYALRYGKSEARIRDYLVEKGCPYSSINPIIERLKENKVINDLVLIDSLISSLSRKGNGKLLIKEKLYQKGFSKHDIDERLDLMDIDEYKEGLLKLYQKVCHKYDKYESFIRNEKLKSYLLRRGYTYLEISFLF